MAAQASAHLRLSHVLLASLHSERSWILTWLAAFAAMTVCDGLPLEFNRGRSCSRPSNDLSNGAHQRPHGSHKRIRAEIGAPIPALKSPTSSAYAKKAKPFGDLARRLRRRRNVGAELQRSWLLAAASAESDSSGNSRDQDGPLHRNHLLKGCPSTQAKCLASNFRGHISAELQRSGLFTTASAQSNSSDDDGEHDCTLHSIFSYVVLALPPALSERAA